MQPDTNFRRRSDDGHQEPTLYDIWQKLMEIETRQINNASAFLVDDLGRPDYDGHRKAHKEMVKASEALEGYKTDATKRIIGIVIGAVCTIIGLGVLTWIQRSNL